MQVLWGIGGMGVILAVAVLLSTNRRAINPRTVVGALVIQVAFAFVVLYWDLGRRVLEVLTNGVQAGIDASNAGIRFLFGPILPSEPGTVVFAFQVLPVIIFFSSLFSVLYYLNILQWVVRIIGGALQRLLRTSQAESMSATADIFLSQVEAALVVRPYVAKMTSSELFTVMVGGMASVAGSVLVGYSLLGAPLEYLIAASFMAAPGALLMAKLMMPETEEPETINGETVRMEIEHTNVIEAAANGAADGLRLALNIGAMLIAFISLIALSNTILGAVGGLFGFGGLTFEGILGYLFSPVAFLIGVPWSEATQAGSFLVQKLVLNEFVAYADFGPRVGELSDKTVAIVTFALAGFANFGSIAIQIGGLGGMAPDRRGQVAKFGVRAVIAATLANLMSGAIAGMLV